MNQLVPANSDFQILQTIARTASSSGLYSGTGGEQKILMIILAAQELGIKPMTALNGGIWNIQGKIEISARLMNSMIRRAGHTLEITGDHNSCTIKGKRSDTAEEHTTTFTIEMANKAGLIKKNRDGSPGMWHKYPEDMLYNRCMSRLARRLFSDVIGMAYVEGEIRDSNIIDISSEVNTNQFSEATKIHKDHSITNTNVFQIQTTIDSQCNSNHSEQFLDMVENTTETINEDEWKSLKILISQCAEKFQENVWNKLKEDDINDENFSNMHRELYNKISLACQGHLSKSKKVKNETSSS